ncbi:MAG: hypothetical protein AABX14_04300 [Candidatus Aenigmatarchaeota archaeon]
MKICPNCKKPCIEFFIGLETGNYRCPCGYIGPIVIEVKKIKKKMKRKK